MRMFNVVYEGIVQSVGASDHIAARRLGSKHLANKLGALDGDKVAVIDVDEAGYGKHTGHCQGCSPHEMCSRSGTCGWCDERYEPAPGESVWNAIQQHTLDTVHEIWSRRASDYKR